MRKVKKLERREQLPYLVTVAVAQPVVEAA